MTAITKFVGTSPFFMITSSYRLESSDNGGQSWTIASSSSRNNSGGGLTLEQSYSASESSIAAFFSKEEHIWDANGSSSTVNAYYNSHDSPFTSSTYHYSVNSTGGVFAETYATVTRGSDTNTDTGISSIHNSGSDHTPFESIGLSNMTTTALGGPINVTMTRTFNREIVSTSFITYSTTHSTTNSTIDSVSTHTQYYVIPSYTEDIETYVSYHTMVTTAWYGTDNSFSTVWGLVTITHSSAPPEYSWSLINFGTSSSSLVTIAVDSDRQTVSTTINTSFSKINNYAYSWHTVVDHLVIQPEEWLWVFTDTFTENNTEIYLLDDIAESINDTTWSVPDNTEVYTISETPNNDSYTKEGDLYPILDTYEVSTTAISGVIINSTGVPSYLTNYFGSNSIPFIPLPTSVFDVTAQVSFPIVLTSSYTIDFSKGVLQHFSDGIPSTYTDWTVSGDDPTTYQTTITLPITVFESWVAGSPSVTLTGASSYSTATKMLQAANSCPVLDYDDSGNITGTDTGFYIQNYFSTFEVQISSTQGNIIYWSDDPSVTGSASGTGPHNSTHSSCVGLGGTTSYRQINRIERQVLLGNPPAQVFYPDFKQAYYIDGPDKYTNVIGGEETWYYPFIDKVSSNLIAPALGKSDCTSTTTWGSYSIDEDTDGNSILVPNNDDSAISTYTYSWQNFGGGHSVYVTRANSNNSHSTVFQVDVDGLDNSWFQGQPDGLVTSNTIDPFNHFAPYEVTVRNAIIGGKHWTTDGVILQPGAWGATTFEFAEIFNASNGAPTIDESKFILDTPSFMTCETNQLVVFRSALCFAPYSIAANAADGDKLLADVDNSLNPFWALLDKYSYI